MIALIKANPDAAAKSGLTVEMVKDEAKEAKGGATSASAPTLQPVEPPKMAKGGKVRSAAQKAATVKMLAALKAKKAHK